MIPERLRNAMLKMFEEHEQDCPGDGSPCWKYRCGVLAFLCHCAGIKDVGKLAMLEQQLETYNRQCPGKDCKHDPL